ncbi:probable phosphorylase b kinase regulatory subunit beta isoform X1 [Ctenocephalides felis]|nr:probable phosphorylase b kinase regulatory subunit beta isoform X1 [Ctenocephalides felis]
MRGILECWIKQANRVEQFKSNQCETYALHCKFHLQTGEPIYNDDEYHHLQIDVVSLYLIFLVQMISSGLQIVYTQDEVAFVQNLVYYVERAYRTPDYGMWERGTKYNDGKPEIHASSIGMAKAALEAINGCNLFGEKGAAWSVIYVDIDAHNRNRSIFETILPRESSSKTIDSSLIPTLSFPAFASHEEELVDKTRSNILLRLKGKYGFKRFSRDGYKCILEDPDRRYYNPGEVKEFDGLECQWPIFFCYMLVDAVFRNNQCEIVEYQNLVKSCVYRDDNNDPILPRFFQPIKSKNPESEHWQVSDSKNILFLWGQSMYIISQLLITGLLHINELDPIRRYLPSYNRPRKSGRYSAFQGTATDLVVQIVLIAESMRLQAMMATYGIQTQTPHEVEPVQIWSSTQLVNVYQQLGVNDKLKLTGRPNRPIGSLGTSKIYRVCGMSVLCYPLIFEVSEFYLYRDMALLIDDIKTELKFVGRYWRLSGRPTVCLLIREEHMRDPQFKEMLDLFAMLKKGFCDGVKVRIGRLQNLISTSCTEHLDFLSDTDLPEDCVSFSQVDHDYIGYQSLTDVPRAESYAEDPLSYMDYTNVSNQDVIEKLCNTTSIMAKCQLLAILLKREGTEFEVRGSSVQSLLTTLYHQAGSLRYWRAVRYCSSLLKYTVDSISPFITAVLVKGKQITVGVIGHKETVFDKPMTPSEIASVIYNTIQPYDMTQAVLQQEVVLYCGRLIATNPQVFKGILKIRVGWVLEAMKIYLEISDIQKSEAERDKKSELKNNPLDNYSPYHVRQLLHKVLTIRDWADKEKLTTLQQRQLEGCLCRVPQHFYSNVWDVLSRTSLGLTVKGYEIPQQPTLSNQSRSELNFALLVEQMLNSIQRPEYRQVIVELLCIVSTILCRNPELCFHKMLDLDQLVMEASQMYFKDNGEDGPNNADDFFATSYEVTTGYLARAVVNSILQAGAFKNPDTITITQADGCKKSVLFW